MVEPISNKRSSSDIHNLYINQELSPESLAACMLIEKAYAATDPGVKEALALLASNEVVGSLAKQCLTEIEQGGPQEALAQSDKDFTALQLTIGFAAGAILNGTRQPDQMPMSIEQAKTIFSTFNASTKLEGHGLNKLIYDLLEQYLHGQISMKHVIAVLAKSIANM